MTTNSYSQSIECPTVGDPPNSYYLINNNFQQSGPMYVKIYFHVFQNDDGSGGLTAAEIEQAKTILNNAYNVHNIYFIYDCNIDFIKNSFLYNNGLASAPVGNMVDEYEPNACITWNQNYKSDALNIYLVNPFGNPTGPRGMADGIPGTRCIIAGSTSGIKNALSSTLPHEVGHCLGLLHTYTGQRKNPKGLCPQINDYGYDCEANLILFPNTNAESSDQCNTTGDKICDTPPDYSEFGSHNTNCNLGAYYPSYPFSSFCSGITNCYPGIGFSSSDMVSIRTADCQIFNPNLTNFMTTASTTSCRTNFTAGQGAVMQNFISSHPALASVKRTADDYANAVNCPCSSEDIHIYNAQTYNTNQIIPGNIYVHAGGNLVITAQLGFTESKGIIVERGGKLWLTGPTAKLTAACNYKWWNGIEVEGNNAIAQPNDYLSSTTSTDAGIVYVENNATIEKAQIGISTIRHNERWNEAFWGGLVQVKDSYFKYNRKAIEFMRYRVGLNGTNKSYITNTAFDGSSPNSATTEGVTIWSSDGIKYERNRHYNFDKSGITIVDGWIKVNNSHVFNNNQSGVSCYATAPANSEIEIGDKTKAGIDNYFNNNQKGIECYGANGLKSGRVNIYQNEFNGGQTAIGLQGTNEHKVGFNAMYNQPYGLYISNTGDDKPSLEHCNTFQDNQFGIIFNGNNALTQFKFNDFLGNSGNEVLLFSYSSTVPTEIRNKQGIAGDPAENCFMTAEQSNQIYTFGNTLPFEYFVPIDISISCQVGGPIPYCNLSDACTTPNNYTKTSTINPKDKLQDCADLKNTEPPIFTLNNYNQFDSLYQLHQGICNTVPANCVLATDYFRLRAQAMRDVVKTYLGVNNWTAAENFLINANFEEAKRTLYGLYFRNRNWSNATTVLNSLPATNNEQRQFKYTQSVALDYAQAPGTFILTQVKDSILNVIANGEFASAAHAKSLLYLIKGETFGFNVPVLPRSSASVSDKKLGTSQLVVYPNPSNQLLSVETSEGIDILELQLIDLQGSIIKSSLPGMQKYQLETSTIPQGTYLLKVNLSNQTVETVKVHIVH